MHERNTSTRSVLKLQELKFYFLTNPVQSHGAQNSVVTATFVQRNYYSRGQAKSTNFFGEFSRDQNDFVFTCLSLILYI